MGVDFNDKLIIFVNYEQKPAYIALWVEILMSFSST